MKTKNYSSIFIYIYFFSLFIFFAILSTQQLYKVKDKVQIKAVPFDLFKAHRASTAGGVFGVRIIH